MPLMPNLIELICSKNAIKDISNVLSSSLKKLICDNN